jgi:hypothetical protein
MTVEHAEELKKLAEHVQDVLNLFPWPADSPRSEDSIQTQVGDMRTQRQVEAENGLRNLRVALGGLPRGRSLRW